MDNFDKIIKQKAEQFDVPFNEAHWAEMEGKLNTIRATKIKNTIFGAAAAVAVIAIASYFTISTNSTNKKSQVSENNTPSIENSINDQETITILDNTKKTVANTVETDNKNIITEKISNTKEIVNLEVPTDNKKIELLNEIDDSSNKTQKTNVTKVTAEFIVYNNNVCFGEEVRFEPLESEAPVSYTWNFGDGTISHEAKPIHIYKSSHTYTVSLTLLNRQTGKETTTIQNDVITILATPKTAFSYSETAIKNDANKMKYPYTVFKIKEDNKNNSYKWSFGNGETSTSKNPKTIYAKKETNYTVTLTAENTNGCTSSNTKKIFNQHAIDLFAANAIKPNSTISKNKTFIPGALLGWNIRFKMTILNKSGKTIYQTSNKDEPWNGRLNNSGQTLDEGIYLWQVITYDAEGTSRQHTGQLKLIK